MVEEVRSLRYFKAIDNLVPIVFVLLFSLERQKNAIRIVLSDPCRKQPPLDRLTGQPFTMDGKTKIAKRILDLLHGRGWRVR